MKKSLLAVTIALAFSAHAQVVFAQAAISTGGAGGAGGTAAGGTAAGGAATNSNTLTTTGGTGGSGGQGGTGGSAALPQAAPRLPRVCRPARSRAQATTRRAEVTVNYITPVSPGGLKGLAAGVDPETGHFVNDNNVRYSGTQKIKNTPDASIGGPASGPCNGFSGGIGVSVPGFAVGANTSTVDPGCTARETARIAAMLGRMDIANAVLENTSVVQEALKAKAARQAAEQAPPPVARLDAPVQSVPAPVQSVPAPVQSTPNREIEAARLSEQQRFAVEALKRKATMDKVYDTLTFTDAVSQGSEKTPQQAMAEEATRTQAERAKRQDEQMKLERRLVALRSGTAGKAPERSGRPWCPTCGWLSRCPRRLPSQPLLRPQRQPPPRPRWRPRFQRRKCRRPPRQCRNGQGRDGGAEESTSSPRSTARKPRNCCQRRARREQCDHSVTGKGSGPGGETRGRASAPAAPAQSRREPDAVAPAAKVQPQLASQPVLRDVKMEKAERLFGLTGAKAVTDPVAPDAAARNRRRRPRRKPDGTLQAAKRDAPTRINPRTMRKTRRPCNRPTH